MDRRTIAEGSQELAAEEATRRFQLPVHKPKGRQARPHPVLSCVPNHCFMPLRSLPQGGSCPDSDACPTSCRPRGAVLLPPASAPTCHRETHPQPAFSVALHVATVLADCWSANSASARAETHSSTASLRSRMRTCSAASANFISFSLAATCSAFCRAAARSSCA